MGVWREAVEKWRALPDWARWTTIGAAGSFFLLASLALVVPWIGEQALIGRVKERGLTADVGSSRIGFGRLWFRDVRLRDPALPELEVRLGSMEVRATFGQGAAIGIHGAFIRAGGISEERLVARFRELTGLAKGEAAGAARSGARRIVTADGVGLSWSDARGRLLRVWGGRLSQRASGEASLAADLVRTRARRVGAELRGLEAEIDAERRFTSLQVATLSSRVDLAPAEAGGEEISAEDAGSKDGGWHQRLGAMGSAIRPHTSERFRGAVVASSVEFARGAESLSVGPSRASVTRERDGLRLELLPHPAAAEGGTPLSLRARIPFAAGVAELDLAGGPVSLSALGVREGDFGLVGVRETRLEARAQLRTQDFARTELSSKGVLENLRLRRPALSPNEISAVRLGWHFEGELGSSAISMKQMELSLGDARVEVSGDVSFTPERTYADLKVAMPLAACNALLNAVPRGMAPLIEGVRAEGTFALAGRLTYDSQRPGATQVGLRVDNQCRIREVPAAIAAKRFRGPWLREVKAADGSPMSIESGPSTRDWVQYEDISPFMETAVLVCEDGHFFTHKGFDYSALENSVRMNLEAGRFLRGGSTISMQLAKNLYLGKEKTISRKLQEAVLTLLLEQQLTKHEIMELYLNVIEFGPGIYGIRQASRYYFNEEPRDLSLGQALYLASILPNPDAQHFLPDGRVSDGYTGYLQKLMHVAKKIRRISEEELNAGLAERVQFRSPNQQRVDPSMEEEMGADAEAPRGEREEQRPEKEL